MQNDISQKKVHGSDYKYIQYFYDIIWNIKKILWLLYIFM